MFVTQPLSAVSVADEVIWDSTGIAAEVDGSAKDSTGTEVAVDGSAEDSTGTAAAVDGSAVTADEIYCVTTVAEAEIK